MQTIRSLYAVHIYTRSRMSVFSAPSGGRHDKAAVFYLGFECSVAG